jgi:uncharacterized protein YbgA (DUF1722 family)/uncharacterized protein YbbK (DUF523 family)
VTDTYHHDQSRIRLGISACLLGQPVRFDGGHKRDPFLTTGLGPFVEWVPVCPEDESGLGTPREAMRLVRGDAGLRLLTVRSRRDVTEKLTAYSAVRVRELATLGLDGFVLKKDSPSCGLTRTKVYSENGVPVRAGRGLFAEALCKALPTLPMEEEGRLCDPAIREHFIERVFAHHRLRQLIRRGPSIGDLVQFHTRHKLLLLAHAPARYAELGRLVARAGSRSVERLTVEYAQPFMAALATAVTRGRHVNVLQHVIGYFRGLLSSAARHDLAATIAAYQRGVVPLVVPMRLVTHYATLHDVRYLREQVYFDPYPDDLMLRNHV